MLGRTRPWTMVLSQASLFRQIKNLHMVSRSAGGGDATVAEDDDSGWRLGARYVEDRVDQHPEPAVSHKEAQSSGNPKPRRGRKVKTTAAASGSSDDERPISDPAHSKLSDILSLPEVCPPCSSFALDSLQGLDPPLRPHQADAIEAVIENLNQGVMRQLISIPTGATADSHPSHVTLTTHSKHPPPDLNAS